MSLDVKPRFAKGTVHSAVNGAILAYLKTYGPSLVVDIDQALMSVDGFDDDSDCTRLKRKLYKLCEKRLVHCQQDEAGQQLWIDGSPPFAKEGAYRAFDGVPPRQFDVMRAPVWQPGRGPVLRPGALDFKAVPSQGVRC
jgi:hypothetical protein